MEVLNLGQCQEVSGGNLVIPLVSSVAIGTCTGLLFWAAKTAIMGRKDDFHSTKNFLVEGSSGAIIATLGALGFIFAA